MTLNGESFETDEADEADEAGEAYDVLGAALECLRSEPRPVWFADIRESARDNEAAYVKGIIARMKQVGPYQTACEDVADALSTALDEDEVVDAMKAMMSHWRHVADGLPVHSRDALELRYTVEWMGDLLLRRDEEELATIDALVRVTRVSRRLLDLATEVSLHCQNGGGFEEWWAANLNTVIQIGQARTEIIGDLASRLAVYGGDFGARPVGSDLRALLEQERK